MAVNRCRLHNVAQGQRLTALLPFVVLAVCSPLRAQTWDIETVDAEGDVGAYTSLALDSLDFPHISYRGISGLKYASKDGFGWHIQTVDSEDYVGYWISLRLDSSGFPHISYVDLANGELKYAFLDVYGWHVESLDAPGSGWYTSLALDSSGFPHIGHGFGDLFYSYQDSSGWHHETADGNFVHVTYGTCIALDSSGFPHISYMVEEPGGGVYVLRYALKDESGWLIQTIDSEGDVGQCTSLELDAEGYPHISYYDDTNDDLKYARLIPTPMELTGTLQDGRLRLTWTPVAGVVGYWVYGAGNEPFFVPGFAPAYEHRLVVLPPWIRVWTSADGIGDPSTNWTYMVMATDASEQELARSNRVGEVDYLSDVP